MVRFFLASCGLLVACASLYGWGMAVRRFARADGGSRPLTMALGLAVLLPIGGLLNLVRLATPVALWLIVGIGLVLFIPHVKSLRMRWPRQDSGQVEVLTAAGLITLVIGVAIFTQLPPSAFNYHDDFHKYLAHPVRMLATGTLFGSPLSAIGSESLGGLAFLHAFPLLVAPVEYINGVDAILAFLLLMMLGASAGWGRLAPLPGAALAPLLIAFINPQYVNVSSLFTGAALIAAAVMLAADDREKSPPSPIALGLIYGGLVALKPIFLLFPLVHLPLTALSIAYTGKSWRAGLVWGLQAGLCSAAALLPWVLLHAPHYLSMQALPTDPIPPAATPDRLHIFSINTLAYGTSHAHYAMLLSLTLVVAGMAIAAWRRPTWRVPARAPIGIAVATASLVLSYAALLAAGPSLAGYDTSLRYTVPFFLGITPFVLVLGASIARPSRFGPAIPIFAILFCVAIFAPSFVDRYRQAVRTGSILAFSRFAQRPDYRDSNREALSDSRAETLRGLQALIPAGEPFVAWISTPFHLDFSRNPVLDVEPAGLTTAWARRPANVRYVLWEHTGFGVPTPQNYIDQARTHGVRDRTANVRALIFGKAISDLSEKAEVLHHDGRIMVFRIKE
jgi:hypothetical protein